MRISLSHSTVAECTPLQAIDVAAATGCDFIGIRLMSDPPGGEVFPIMRDATMRRETARHARECGVGVLDVEVARLQPETDVAAFAPFLEAAAELGARRVLATGDDADQARLTATFAAFCDEAAAFALGADLEFVPWLTVGDPAAAARIVGGAGRPNGGILVDTLHLDRAGGDAGDLARLDPALLHYVQISDAPAVRPRTTDEMIHTAREERLFPGEGGLDLVTMLQAMPSGIPVALEAPTVRLAQTMPARERMMRAVAATRRVLAAAGWA